MEFLEVLLLHVGQFVDRALESLVQIGYPRRRFFRFEVNFQLYYLASRFSDTLVYHCLDIIKVLLRFRHYIFLWAQMFQIFIAKTF